MKAALYILLLLLVTGCRKEYDSPIPNTNWDLFDSFGAIPVDPRAQGRMDGVYTVVEGADMFGAEVVLQWSWTHDGPDTTYNVSLFGEKDVTLITGTGKYLDSTILLNTWWRTLANMGTGMCRLTMAYDEGVRHLWGSGPIGVDSIRIEGVYGMDGGTPDRPFVLTFRRPLYDSGDLQVLAHRGGARNADGLPASENSVEMIRMASRLGATGIEIDVRLTSDGVPIIYHDETLNPRLIRPCGLIGPIANYSYAQLSGLVRLIHGERIPTLREALDAVVHNTSLECVWLDTKYDGSMQVMRDIQQEYIDAAAAAGRDVRILIGLPGNDQVENFLALPDHAEIPSLCEEGIDEVHATDAEVWAPRWTDGLQHAEVAQMHGEGRLAFVWTVDDPSFMQQYLQEGDFDGMLSNYPMLVAYYDHVRP